MTAEEAARRGLKFLAKIVGHATMCNIARHPASVLPNSRRGPLKLSINGGERRRFLAAAKTRNLRDGDNPALWGKPRGI